MPDKAPLREVTLFGRIAWVALSMILGGALTNEAHINVQGWWFEVTVLFAFLLGELFTVLYDKWASESRGEIWVPAEFVVFIVVVLGGAWVGAEVTAFTASAFNSVTVVAYIMFGLLNFGTSFFLYMDFLHHAHFRIWGRGPQATPAPGQEAKK